VKPSVAGVSLLLAAGAANAQLTQFLPVPGISGVPGCNAQTCVLSGSAGYSGVRVSDDGRYVATVAYIPGEANGFVPLQGARWTPGGPLEVITPPLDPLFAVVGISADGSTVLGRSWRWTAANGYEDLVPLLRDTRGIWTSQFFGISDDAQVYAGLRGFLPDAGDMFRRNVPTGQVTILPRAPGAPGGYNYFNCISGNGRVVAGAVRQPPSESDPVRFDSYAPVVIDSSGPRLLAPLTSSNFQGVTDLNFDGTVAVGVIAQSFQLKAFRWNGGSTLEILQSPTAGSFDGSYARAVNRDGTVIVGEYLRFGTPGTRAWIWRAGVGFSDLQDELSTVFGLGDALAGWRLLVATDVSGDGKVIVGQGVNPDGVEQAFYVRFRESTCPADLTGIGGPPSIPDGLLTGDDFNAFISAFAAGDLLADLTGIGGPPAIADGLITGDDFNAFIAAFAAGCP